jgi:hypothetical protein
MTREPSDGLSCQEFHAAPAVNESDYALPLVRRVQLNHPMRCVRAAQRSGVRAAPGSAPRGARRWKASRTRLARFCGRWAGWADHGRSRRSGCPGAAGGGLPGVLGCLRASYGHCPACVCVWGARVQRLGRGALLTV